MAKKKPPNFAAEPGPALHSARWRVGEFELNESRRELTRNGTVIELEPKPLNMLMLMLRHPGELITKNDLMEALWTGRIVTEAVLSNCAAKLRSALGADEAGVRIRTVHGYGYRLEAAPVLLVADAPIVEPPSFVADSAVSFRPNWLLKRRLGQSGETWLGEQISTLEQRVFKFAHTPRQLSSLKREVTLYRLLRQTLEERAPVVDLLDWNFDEPPWYIEVEYCELGSLAEYLDSVGGVKALPIERRIALVIQLAEALAAVHSVGILHKDLKPANVLVAPSAGDDLRIRLCDFGAGRLIDFSRLDSLAITRLGFTQFADSPSSSSSSGGTPLYYAPEVLSGQPATLKADIYALGVIFYQLVVGDLRRLFAPGWEAGVTDELIREDIAAASAGDPHLRLVDAGLLAQRLRQLPARRVAQAEALAAREAAAATVLALHRAEARRSGYRLAAAALALGLVVSLGLFWQARQARNAALRATEAALSTRDFVLKDVLGTLAEGALPVAHLSVADLLKAAAAQAGSRFARQPRLEAEVRFQLAMALVELNNRDAASVELLAAQKLSLAAALAQPGQNDLLFVQIVSQRMLNDFNRNLFATQAKDYGELHQRSIRMLGAGHPALFDQYRVMAFNGVNEGEFASAAKIIDDALRLAEKLPDLPSSQRAHLLQMQAGIESGNGAYEKAIASVNSALIHSRKAFGEQHKNQAQLLCIRARAEAYRGRFAAAAETLSQAAQIYAVWEPTPAEGSLILLEAQGLLATEENDRLGMEQVLKQFAIARRNLPADLASQGIDDVVLKARLQLARGQIAEALASAQRLTAASATEGEKSKPGFDRFEHLQLQAEAQLGLGQLAEAAAVLKHLDQTLPASFDADHPLRLQQTYLKALQARKFGQMDAAASLNRQGYQQCLKKLSASHWRCQRFQR